jgi:hypothetical protein
VGSFPTEVGGFKPDFWKMKTDMVFIQHSESIWYDISKGEIFMRLEFLLAALIFLTACDIPFVPMI